RIPGRPCAGQLAAQRAGTARGSERIEEGDMALHHAVSGEKIALQRGDDDIAHFTSVALVKTEHMELIRLVLPVERPIPEHRVDGEVTIVCLEGEIAVDAHDKTTNLQPSE